jgi:hypothetical protein
VVEEEAESVADVAAACVDATVGVQCQPAEDREQRCKKAEDAVGVEVHDGGVGEEVYVSTTGCWAALAAYCIQDQGPPLLWSAPRYVLGDPLDSWVRSGLAPETTSLIYNKIKENTSKIHYIHANFLTRILWYNVVIKYIISL